jgi:hypothetical protein
MPEHLSTRQHVEMITASNARHAAAALPLGRAADLLEAVAEDVTRLAAKLPEMAT